MRRWLTIRLQHLSDGRWIWFDEGGYGDGVYKLWICALLRALWG